MKEKISVILADDHKIVTDGLKFMIDFEKNIEVITTASSTSEVEAFLLQNSASVNILVSDINMPSISGIELCKRVKTNYPHIKVLLLSMYESKEIIREALQVEADGYLLKNINRETLIKALNQLYNDGTFYSEEIIPILLNEVQKEKRNSSIIEKLTEREKEILTLIALEITSEEIAEKLFISIKTVGNHRQNILLKTKSKSAVGLVKVAIKSGLINI